MKLLMIVYKCKTAVIFFVLLSILGTPVFAQNLRKMGEGRVLVTVRDSSVFLPSSVNEALDPDVDVQHYLVFLQNNGSLFEMEYNEQLGRFELSVPEGVYEIVLKDSWGGSPRYRRANIYVRSGRTESLFIGAFEIGATLCDKRLGFLALTTHSYPDKTDLPISYDNFLVNGPYNMVIRYCSKKVEKEKISYGFVFLTYKNLTVYAEKAVLDRQSFVLRGSGNVEGKVTIVKENCIKKGEKVIINLNVQRQAEFDCLNMQIK